MSILQSTFRWVHGSQLEALGGIPGPAPSFPLGNAADFLSAKPWELLERYAADYGALTLFWLGGTPTLFVADPDLIAEILIKNPGAYYKDVPVEAFSPVLTSDAPFVAPDLAIWEPIARRSLLAQVTHGDQRAWLDAQVAVIRAEATRGLGALAGGGETDAMEALQRIGFDVLSRMTMGALLGDEQYRALVDMATFATRRLTTTTLAPDWLPSFTRARERWFDAIRVYVKAARASNGEGGGDMLRAGLRGGTALDDEQLVHELSSLIFGGLFSVTSATVGVLFELSRRPEVARPLVEELSALVTTAGPELGWPALSGCARLDRVVRETLRTYPPAPIFLRNVRRDGPARLGKTELPADTKIWLSPWPLQRAPARWPDPARWDPDRWTAQVIADNPYGSGYFWPFGRGPRTCGGQAMAVVIIKAFLATVLLQSDPTVGAGQTYDGAFFFGVLIPNGFKARFPARRAP